MVANGNNRMAGSNPMIRTGSSGGTSGGGSSGNPFGRMFRRYSQGTSAHVRTSSNASDGPAQLARTLTPTNGLYTRATASMGRSLPPTPLDSSNTSGSRIPAPASTTTDSAFLDHLADNLNVTPASAPPTTTTTTAASDATSSSTPATTGTSPSLQTGVHRIRLVPHLEATRSLHFEPIERDVRQGAPSVKIGRFTDRGPAPASTDDAAPTGSTVPTGSAPGNRGGAVPSTAGGGGRIDSGRIAFKSKVVSRGHAEIWCEPGGKFFIRDTKSSSGTFLNHIRLAGANLESKPFAIKDGDILQLGVDYQGGTEEIYRCVKIRVELNRGWQREANQFNVNALRQLRALQGSPIQAATANTTVTPPSASGTELPTNRQSMNVSDCCICLFSVTVCQALFIAPCSHVFHYKCIRPLLSTHYPGFSCPLCRTFADLEADVEEDEAWQAALLKEAEGGTESGQNAAGPSTPMVEVPTSIGGSSGQTIDSPFIPTASQREGAASITPSQSNAPFTSSRLRQQLHHDGGDLGAHESADHRLRTAVGNNAPPAEDEQYDGTAVFPQYPTRRGVGGGGEDDEDEEDIDRGQHGGDQDEEEEEEMLVDDRTGFGPDVIHEIERISEEGDRPTSSSNGGPSRDLHSRRGSRPITIQGHSPASGSSSIISRYPVGQAAEGAGFSPLEEARTPVNQHVLSVLAEAPPPTSAAARRMAVQRQYQQQQTLEGRSMLSIGGVSSGLLDTPLRNDDSKGSDAGSRRGSYISEDAGYLTPAEGSMDGHATFHSIASRGSGGGVGVSRSVSAGSAAGSAGIKAAAKGGTTAGVTCPGPTASAGASTSSNRASPSTAGGMDIDQDEGNGAGQGDDDDDDDEEEEEEGDYAMIEAGSGPGPDLGVDAVGSQGGGGRGAMVKSRGKSRKRETSNSGGSLDSTTQRQQQTAASATAAPPLTQATTTTGGGGGGTNKVKSIFKKATGHGGGGTT